MDIENDASPVTRGILKQELQAGLQAFQIEIHDVLSNGLNALESKLTIRILQSETKLEKKIDQAEERVSQRHRETIETIQRFAGKVEHYERETFTLRETLDHHGKRLDDHDSRIRSLEL